MPHIEPMKSRPQKSRHRSRIFLVDDHAIFREGLALLLQAQPDFTVCGSSVGGLEALRAIQRAAPDAVVMDIALKGMSGLELTSMLHKHFPRMPVLVLSLREEADYAERALRAGAAGFISKEATSTLVSDMLRRVLRGELALTPDASGRILRRAVAPGAGAGASDPIASLSDRELEVFQLLGQGYSTRRIAEHLGRSIKTIESHREALKRKLDLSDAAQLAQRAAAWAARRQEG